MKARTRSTPERQIDAERLLLTALCQQTISQSAQEEVLRHFAARKFAHAEHQVVFWALSQLPARDPAIIRELLATRLTVMGFPDLDFDVFFKGPVPSESEISTLLQLL